jgi:aminoglycoside phosphotransferase (APT) family kinase protein
MNEALRTLIHRLERSLSLAYQADASGPRPCRAGELFRLCFGDRFFALKLYDEGYFNDRYLHRALAVRAVPVPAIHASDDSGDLVGKPWILREWVDGDHQITDRRAVARQVGQMLREIHSIEVDGAGARRADGWEFADWHTLVESEASGDGDKVRALEDLPAHRSLYLAVVDEFARLGRRQPNRSFLLHGDLGPDNVIVHENRVVALIDAGWFVGGHPLLDLSYVVNSRLAEEDGMLALLEGYGGAAVDSRALAVLRMYHLVGKLLHFSATGQREKYERRREVLLELAARNPL